MIKKYKDYILLLGIFLLFILANNINRFLIFINSNLDDTKIIMDYNNYLKEELDNIKKINDIKINDNLNLKVSRVKYRDVYEYTNTITIFKGFKNGVFKGDVVLNNEGLIGVVTKTYDYHLFLQIYYFVYL